MRIPALLLLSILVVNALFFPGAKDMLVSLGPLSISREGLIVRADLGGAGARRVPRVRGVPVHHARGRPARVAHRPRRQPPDRVRRPVGRPDGAADAGPGRRRSSRPSRPAGCRSRARSCGASGRSSRSSDRSCSDRSWTSASGRSRSRRAGSARGRDRTAYRIVADPPVDRWLRLAILGRVPRGGRGGRDRDRCDDGSRTHGRGAAADRRTRRSATRAARHRAWTA